MTPADLDRIESSLGVTLPMDYRGLMQNYPFAAETVAHSSMLIDDPDWVIGANRGVDTHFMLHHRQGRWVPTRDYLQIGNDGGENCYYLDLRGTPPPVYGFDLEAGTLSVFAADLGDYTRRCTEIDEELAEEERLEAEWLREKKWWQFWR